MPTSVGYQDLAALIARQPAVTERWRQHIRTSTFGTIHAATFSFPRPMGAAIPDPYFTQLASLDPRALDVTGSVPLHAPIEPSIAPPSYDFPQVNRSGKGDRLPVSKPASAPATQPAQPAPSAPVRKGDRAVTAAIDPASDAALKKAAEAAGEAMQAARVMSSVPRDVTPEPEAPEASVTSEAVTEPSPAPVATAEPTPAPAPEPEAKATGPATEIADLESSRPDIHGAPLAPAPLAPVAPVADAPETKPAAPVAQAPKAKPEPVTAAVSAGVTPKPAAKTADRMKAADRAGEEAVEALVQFTKPGKQTSRLFFGTHAIGLGEEAALKPWQPDEVPTVLAPPHVDPEIKRAALDPTPDADTETPGETVAPKGEVTGEGKRPRTPAERLNLSGPSRAKHEKCLANAIYFEARGEVERGQMAVAQVVLNRAFSGYYPGNVCDVVYQNAHRHLACQFTFACDNHRDVVNDPKAWSVATRIARDALDGRFWLPEIGKATHYHATYVNPWWVRTMTKHSKLGIHIFYRPKRWGEGEEIPVWGDRLDVTGTITPMPDFDKSDGGKHAGTQPVTRRSIFDPVEEIKPGG